MSDTNPEFDPAQALQMFEKEWRGPGWHGDETVEREWYVRGAKAQFQKDRVEIVQTRSDRLVWKQKHKDLARGCSPLVLKLGRLEAERDEILAENDMLRKGGQAALDEMDFMRKQQIPAIHAVYEEKLAKLQAKLDGVRSSHTLKEKERW